MLPETGPDNSPESETASDSSPENSEIKVESSPGKKPTPPKKGQDDNNGGPATPDQLKDLKENGIGSKAPEDPELRPEMVNPDPDEIPPRPVDESGQEDIQSRPTRHHFARIEPKQVKVPADIAAKGEEAVRNYLETQEEATPTTQTATEETEPDEGAKPEDAQEAVSQIVAGSQGQIVSDEVVPPSPPKSGGLWQRLFSRKGPGTVPPQEPPPPETEQPPDQVFEEKPVAISAEEVSIQTGEPVSPPPPEDQKPQEKSIEDEVEERYTNLGSGSELKIGKTNYKVDKIDAEQVGGEQIVRIKLVKPNGETWYRYDHEIKAAFEKQIIVERKEAEQQAKSAAQELAKEEARKAKEAEREAKKAEKESHLEQLKARPKVPEEKVATKMEELESGARAHGSVFFGEEQLKFQRFDKDQDSFVFKDEQGNERTFSRDETINALRSELEKETRVVTESEKPESRVGHIAGRTLEQVSKGAKALIETVEKNQVGAFLVRQANAFLNKFDYRDKEKSWYAAGIAVGAGTNVALTAFSPFLAHGPGRILRSAAFSGVLLGVSKGANIFRNMSMNKILSNFGIEDKVERQNYASQFDQAFRLLGSGGEDGYHETMKKISTEIFTKYGNSQSRTDIEGSAATLSSEVLQKRIETLSTKYKNLNNGIRSFSAGLSVGTIGATGFFGLEKFVSHAFDKMPHLGVLGGKPDVPTVPHPSTPTPEVPDHTPGIPDQTPGPTIPVPETPTLDQILANPEYTNVLEIQQGDTVGSILTNAGYDIDWGPDNAEVFGAHIQANYDMLSNMHDNVAATGMSVEDFPTQAEISALVQQADVGDAVAMHRLTEAMHWIPAGGDFTVVSPEAIELVNNTQGR